MKNSNLKHLFLLVLCVITLNVQAFTVDGISYTIIDETNKTINVTSNSPTYTGDVVVPETVNYNGAIYRVTGIGDNAFYMCYNLTSIELPMSVTSIGSSAFYGCSKLTSIEIPNSVTSIGSSAFSDCTGLTSIELPESVTSIGSRAFSDCTGLTSIEIPNSVTSIESFAFEDCTGLTSIELPESVTSIESWVFGGCTGLTSIEIPNSVTNIGSLAFVRCTGLTSMEIPNSVTSIGGSAFQGCTGLTSITVSEGNSVYDSRENCNAIIETSTNALILGCKNTLIPTSVTSIGSGAFLDCTGLTSMEIPNSVTSIAGSAFQGCTGLTSITVSEGNSVYDSRENCNAIIETLTNSLIVGCKNTVIPLSVVSIGLGAFSYCTGLTSIEIPNSVTSIGIYAFSGCTGLTSIEIPNSVISIGDYAFSDCTGLTSVISLIPAENLFTINSYVFNNVDKTKCTLYVPEGAKSTYSSLLSGWWSTFTNIEELPANGSTFDVDGIYYKVTDSNNRIVAVTYQGASYSSSNEYTGDVVIPETTNLNGFTYRVTGIGDNAFRSCSDLTNVTIPKSVTTIGSYAFRDCSSLTTIDLPDNLTAIADYIFRGCLSLNSVEIPDNVTKIGSYAFYNCTGLTNIELPESVTSIGSNAFYGCSGLTSVTSLIPAENLFTINTNVFNNVDKTKCMLYVPVGAKSTYSSTSGWSSFTNIYELGSAPIVYSVSVSATEGGEVEASATEVEEGATVTLTATPNDGYKFTNWTLGGEVVSTDNPYQATITANSNFVANFEVLPTSGKFEAVNSDGVTIWYNITSYNTAEVTYKGSHYSEYSGEYSGEVNIPSTVEYSGNTYSVTAIGNYAFLNCKGLTSVVIPEGVTTIGNHAFYDCAGLTSVVITEGVTSIGNSAFDGCKGLTSVVIPEGVTSIGNSAFSHCDGLTSVTIPNSVTTIGEDAFFYCKGLTSVVIPEGVTSIGNSAFYYCKGLTEIEVAEGNINYSSEDGVLFNKDKTELIQYPIGNSRTSYSIPESVTSIGSNAFSNCDGLTSVVIPEGVTSIGNYAFYYCKGLTSVTIPNSVTTIGYDAFYACNGLTSVVIPEGVTSIGNSAFSNCDGLTSVTIPNSVTTIGDRAFSSCDGLTEIEVAEGNINYSSEDGVLFNKDKTELIQYPKGNSRTSYSIPESVTTIGNYAFFDCDGLTSVTIPNSVTTIGKDAFFDCDGLTEIYSLNPTAPDITSTTFADVSKTIPVYIPKGSLSSYQSAEYWSKFTNFVEIKEIYTISVSSSDESMGSAVASATEVEEGSTVTLTATPNEGYEFVNWTVNGEVVSTENPYTAIVTANTEYIALFRLASVFVTKINISQTEASLLIGKELQLTATILPNNATDKNIVWSSQNSEIATVDQTGKITAISAGTTTITVSAQDGSGVTAECEVTVLPILKGDSNDNEVVTVTDAVNTTNYIVGKDVLVFNYDAADVTSDGNITISDVSGTITIVLEQPIEQISQYGRLMKNNNIEDYLLVEDFELSSEGTALVGIAIDNTIDYTALQADITMGEGIAIEDIALGDGVDATHKLQISQLSSETTRVVIYSPINRAFKNSGTSLLQLNIKGSSTATGDISINNIYASDALAQEYMLMAMGGVNITPTSLRQTETLQTIYSVKGGVILNGFEMSDVNIYSMTGLLIKSEKITSNQQYIQLPKGMYIVTIANKVEKVIVGK